MGSVVQWRKFNFFDIKRNIDDGKFAELLKDAVITCTGSGRGIIYLGDSDGFVYSVSRQLQISTFRAHDEAIKIILAQNNSGILLTVQGSSSSCATEIKVWDTSRIGSVEGSPVCLRTIKPDPRPTHSSLMPKSTSSSQPNSTNITAISLHPNNALLAVGFDDGSLMLYRGDIRRERGSKSKVIVTFANSAITGLHLKHSVRSCYLFVTTTKKTYCVNCSLKDKESTIELDDAGCGPRCSALADSKHEHELLIARKDAIYTYTVDSKASCYVFEGQKICLSWFKGYIIVVSRDESLSSSRGSEGKGPTILTVYDPANKLVSLSTIIEGFVDVIGEWGGLYVLVSGPHLWHLSEKDLQSKFELLFKKNQFDIAINLAKLQCCDEEEVAEILKQYGDWLYQKGNFLAAMNQYTKTIPHLEPSYVIKKFLDTQHIDILTTYLQALHKSGNANCDHTTLMLNCYTRLRDSEQLDNFILQGDVDCDVELGIKVCRGAGYFDHAMALASKYNLHQCYISILIEDKKDYHSALKYIMKLDFESAKSNILSYGSSLLNHIPDQTGDFLVTLCTDFREPNQQLTSEKPVCADPEEFEYLLIGHSEVAIDFLEKVMTFRNLSKHLNTTLLAELLHQHSIAPEGQDQNTIEDKILKMLRINSGAQFDRDHALLLCDKHKFFSGKLLLWEQAGMFEELLTWHAAQGDFDAVVDVCERHAESNRSLWCSALRFLTAEKGLFPPSTQHITKVLDKIDEGELMPSLEVVDLLTSSPHVTLGQVRDYLLKVVNSHSSSLEVESTAADEFRRNTERVKENIRSLNTDIIEFTNTRCDICKNNLDLPSVHFLCRHSFHVHCFESYSEFESECPICYPETKKLRDAMAMQERNASRPDLLQEELDQASDSFSVLADFVARGAFTKSRELDQLHPSPMTTKEFTLRFSTSDIATRPKEVSSVVVPESESRLRALERNTKQYSGVEAEGRLRLTEIANKKMETTSEGRLRQRDRGSAAISEIHSQPKLVERGEPQTRSTSTFRGRLPQESLIVQDSISSSIHTGGGGGVVKKSTKGYKTENPFEEAPTGRHSTPANPFEEDEYETEESGAKNPFAEDSDYDESKNPFASDEPNNTNLTDDKEVLNSRRITSIQKSDNPFEDNYDPNLNPFE